MIKQEFNDLLDKNIYHPEEDDREPIVAAQVCPGSYVFFPDCPRPQEILAIRIIDDKLAFQVPYKGFYYRCDPSYPLYWYARRLWCDGRHDGIPFLANRIAVAV